MKNSRPDWGMWKYMQQVDAKQAVALTLNVEPRSPNAESAVGFADRLFLFKNHHGNGKEITLSDLAVWAQSVEWNIPIELGTLAPLPAEVFQDAPDDVVDLAIASILVNEGDAAELRRALECEGCRFVIVSEKLAIHVMDGTVKGAMYAPKDLYSVASNIYSRSKNSRIGHLMRGSGASGGGARQSNFRDAPSQPPTIARPTAPLGCVRDQLIALADQIANDERGDQARFSLNDVCTKMGTDAFYKKHKDLLTTNKGQASKTWLLGNGLSGWIDPKHRKDGK